MGLIGVGIGPALSGLQIALQRTVDPRDLGGAMGTLLLLRQVGGAIALAAAGTIYTAQAGGDTTGADAAATGAGVMAIALIGAVVTAAALASLPKGAGRLPGLAEARTERAAASA